MTCTLQVAIVKYRVFDNYNGYRGLRYASGLVNIDDSDRTKISKVINSSPPYINKLHALEAANLLKECHNISGDIVYLPYYLNERVPYVSK